MAGCACRAPCCIGQVLFALGRRYLINEKGALDDAAQFSADDRSLSGRVAAMRRAISRGAFDAAYADLRACDAELKALAADPG